MRWLGSWGIGKKLTVLGLLGVVLVSVPTLFYLKGAADTIALAQREKSAIPAVRALLAVITATQNHRGASGGHLAGNAAFSSERDRTHAQASEARKQAEAVLARDAGGGPILEMWARTEESWNEVAAGVAGRSLSADDSYAQHTALIHQYTAILDRVGDHFRISMDSQPETFYLLTTSLVHLPKLTEMLAQLRGKGVVILTQKLATGDDNFNFTKLLGLASMHHQNVAYTLDKAMAEGPEVRQRLEATAQESMKQAQSVIHLADRQIAQTDNLTYSPTDYFNALGAAMAAQLKLNEAALAQVEEQLDRRVARAWRDLAIVLGGIAGIIAAAAAFGLAIGRSVTRPLQRAVAVAQTVAAGDLTSTIEATTSDEVGQLLRALKAMNENLRRIASQVRVGTEAIGSASKQLSAGNADLSQRTEEQASSLEETASSMEELTSTVKHNADSAMQANQLAAGASDVAAEGGKVVREVVTTMSAINDASKKIVDIIAVIDGIAFQTNILALNAAVEAARAGEQGRGFAVVATEVRSLAQRSAAAAKEIKALITDSVSKVDAGSQLVAHAGKTMDGVVASVKRVTDIIAEIAAASREQTSGIEQVNKAIAQMDEVTQQNAALVEQAAAAAESMEEQAQRLTEAVAVFKLGEVDAGAIPTPRRDSPGVVTPLPVKTNVQSHGDAMLNPLGDEQVDVPRRLSTARR